MQTSENHTAYSDDRAASAAHILGLDYGRARIGLALANAVAGLAEPLGVLVRVNRNEDMRRLRELAREHAVKQIVVGLPLRLDGTRGEMAQEAERFARRIQKELGVPVEMVDERLTSWEAERLLEEYTGRFRNPLHDRKPQKTKKNSRRSVDAMAATVILREYLESRTRRNEIQGVER